MRSFRKPERRKIVEDTSRHKKPATRRSCVLDPFRIFYDVEENERFFKIEAVGYKKGSTLFICGKEYKLSRLSQFLVDEIPRSSSKAKQHRPVRGSQSPI